MVTGEKDEEFRKEGKWIESRLIDRADGERPAVGRHYDAVEFTNGYGPTRPRFLVEYKGFDFLPYVYRKYSNGLIVDTGMSWRINLGKILFIHNYTIPDHPKP
jgi:hypothetical protein